MTPTVLRELGPDSGVAAPSANRFGRVSPTSVEHVLDELATPLDPALDVVLDGGPARVGILSSSVDARGEYPILLRPGGIGLDDVSHTAGIEAVWDPRKNAPRVPGSLASHCSPAAHLRVPDARDRLPTPDPTRPPTGVRLSAPQDVRAYASSLYAALREADALGLTEVVCIPPTGTGALATAVRDLLARAAHRGDPCA